LALPLLILFTKAPVPGQVKTRLIPALGAQGAALAHSLMVRRMVERLQGPWDFEVHCPAADPQVLDQWLGNLRFRPQGPGDLGEKMSLAFAEAFARGYKKVALVGSDIPDLGPGEIQGAFAALDQQPLALGPALDGGYYAIALNRPCPELFQGVPWSSPQVLAQTLATAAALKITPTLLPPLADIDEPQDLPRLQALFPDQPWLAR